MTSDSPTAAAASFSAGQSSSHVPIVCGALRGILFHGRLERGVSNGAKLRTRLRNLCNFIKITLGFVQRLHIFVVQELTVISSI